MEFAPDADYTCSVFASTRAGDGPSVNYTVRTLETRKIYCREVIQFMCHYMVYLILYLYLVAPEEPENFAIMVGGSSDLTFIWDPPLVTNGEIDNYTLTCSPTIGLLPMVLEAMINNITLPMFVPGTTYTCSLRASNGGGLGSPAVDTATTLEEGMQHRVLHVCIRESVDSLCRDGADAQYMQYLSKSRITSTQIC